MDRRLLHSLTLAVDPARQNYLTIKLWGSDVDGGTMYLAGTPFAQTTQVTVQDSDNGAAIDQQGGPPAFPGRFFYYTVPIADSLTLGKTTAQMTLNFISYRMLSPRSVRSAPILFKSPSPIPAV